MKLFFINLFIVSLLVGTFLIEIKADSQNEIILVDSDDVDENKNNVKDQKKLDLVNRVDGKIETSDEEFVPTNEWQTIKPGQAIPSGLHVRLNLQTGQREAKILSEQDKKEKQEKDALSKEFEDALKKINNEKFDEISEKTPQEIEREEEIRKKFRTYEQLKEEIGELNLNVQTDYEIIKGLIQKLNQTDLNKDEKLNTLKDLEYLVHQYDNGLLLCDMGGFEMILKEINKTDHDDLDIKIESVLVLGSAVQSNPKVKIFAIKTDLLQMILNRLSSSKSDSIENQEFYSKLIFTLSGLLRNFPYAQLQFIRLGGVQTLSNLIKSLSSIKLKTKLLTLTDDLIKEKMEILNSKIDLNDTNEVSRLEQYKKINLIEELIEKKWCENYEPLLEKAQDHDTREKILASIQTLKDNCKFNNPNLIKILKNLVVEYENLISQEEDDYFSKLYNSIKLILSHLQTSNKIEL